MNACQCTVDDIAVHILTAKSYDFCIIREQSHSCSGQKLHENSNDDAEGNGDAYGIFQSQAGTVMLAGTDILGAEGRNCGQHGGWHKEEKSDQLFHDANGSGIAESALVGKNRDHNEGDLYKSVLEADRNTDLQDLGQNAFLRFKIRER